ncbi:MAG: hypothetical protein P8J37_03055 [Fuerstiella sp.]|nr:hypothetical protein [Fuerstiella sp.]
MLLPETEGARPLTGRVFVALSRQSDDPALGMRSLGHQPIRANLGMPFFGVYVDQLRPGQSAVIDETTPGYPVTSLQDLPAGEYYAKAIFNVYTEFHR